MRQISKIVIFLAIFFQIILFANFAKAQDSSGMYIDNFESKISILPDSWLSISEKIDMIYETSHHGFYRDIPYRYHDKYGNIRNIKIEQISVTDQNGNPQLFTKSYTGGNIELKIGDPNKIVIGEYKYLVKYQVWGALNYFDDQAELYWNATGDKWAFPINHSTAKVNLESGQCLQLTGFLGRYGSGENSIIDQNNCAVSAGGSLDASEALTLVVRWPEELTPPPSALTRITNWIIWNWIYLLPLIVFIFALWAFLKNGLDPKGRGTIAPCFEPPRKMTPLEIGALVDNKTQGRDFSAMIIDFAVRGYISIKEIPKKGILSNIDYELIKKKEPADLKSFEKIVFEELFSGRDNVKLSDLKNSFFKTKKEAEKDLFNQLVNKNFYPASPLTAGAINHTLGIILIVASFFVASPLEFLGISYVATVISMMISGLILIGFGLFMSKRTKEGARAREEILGFKLYLETAEKYRMEFYEKEKYFEKYLPYAMALGVAKIWASKFKNIYKEGNEPDWYGGHHFAAFNAIYFTSAIESDFSSHLNTAFTSTPSSSGSSGFSGGGFSGGGFGGGGGGGW